MTRSRFTLVELMIVVAIIAILAAIAIPVFQNFQLKSRATELPLIHDGLQRALVTRTTEGVTALLPGTYNPDNTPGKTQRAWDNSIGIWSQVGFQPDGQVRGSWWVGITSAGGGVVTVETSAKFDLDGDGNTWNTRMARDVGTGALSSDAICSAGGTHPSGTGPPWELSVSCF